MASNARSNRSSSHVSAATRAARTAAWAAVCNRDPAAMLAVAADPAADVEALAILVPPWDQLAGMPVVVALAVLSHPRCPGGLADRLARHPDVTVRIACFKHSGCGAMGRAVLLADPDPNVRAAARAVLGG